MRSDTKTENNKPDNRIFRSLAYIPEWSIMKREMPAKPPPITMVERVKCFLSCKKKAPTKR